ncbi:MAG: aminotransferase class I/II-fold pyridoxal phosphate-dependent enzyme, partial [Firmicutes bacterium]|nr:aminotransferase class I/II-fold pyridoxal phosphate-dependent enzyme [Bacillota bacterium]
EGFAVAHDIAYADLVFRGEAVSLLAVPGGREVGIEFFTLSKSYNMAGWRIGIAAGNPDLIALLEGLQDHLHTSQFGAVQIAAAAALNGDGQDVAALRATYRRRMQTFVEAAAATGWTVPPSEGTFFLWAPVPPGQSAAAWADRFLEEADVVVAPGTGFGAGGEGFVRISLTAPEADLAEAARRLGAVLQRG